MYKIAHITKYYYPIVGGQQIYIHSLNKLLEKNGCTTLIIQPHVLNQPEIDHILFTKPFPLVYRISKFVTNFSWFLFNWELRKYFHVLKEQDVLISHYSFHLPVLSTYARKLIVLSHGVLYGKGKESFFDKCLAARDQKLLSSGATIVANDTHFLRSIGINIEPSTFYFREIQKNIWFIPNCVDSTFFCPSDHVQKKKVILVPRNIRYDRGIHLAIEAFAIFVQKHKNYQLYIAGGPLFGLYYEECCERIEKYNLQKQVHYLGFVSPNELLELYRSSEITLIPTLDKEGTSLSALESMACGTPVVATNIAGLLDIPCVHSDISPLSVSNALENTIANLDILGKQHRASVVKTFSIENWERAWLNVINRINGEA